MIKFNCPRFPILLVNPVKTYEGDVLDLGLDFTMAVEEFGETRIELLKPEGDSTPVTSDNRIEYIHLVADYKLNRQIKNQCIAFRLVLFFS